MNTKQAKEMIKNWPEPYKSDAMKNIVDAEEDLMDWPHLWDSILTDMSSAIYEHEKEMKEEQNART